MHKIPNVTVRMGLGGGGGSHKFNIFLTALGVGWTLMIVPEDYEGMLKGWGCGGVIEANPYCTV